MGLFEKIEILQSLKVKMIFIFIFKQSYPFYCLHQQKLVIKYDNFQIPFNL